MIKYKIWNGLDINQSLKYCDLSTANHIKNTIDQYSKNGMPYNLVISDFHFVIDDLSVKLIKKIGYPLGECPYYNIDKKCPLVETDLETLNEYQLNLSLDHSHIGNWKRKFIKKNGYDHGIELFVFKYSRDLETAKMCFLLNETYEILQ